MEHSKKKLRGMQIKKYKNIVFNTFLQKFLSLYLQDGMAVALGIL